MIQKLYNTTSISWYRFLLGTTIALFCVAPKSISLCLIILVLFTAFQVVKGKMKFQFQPLFSALVLFYLAYVVGAIFTNHVGDALSYFEKKMSLVIFPVLFCFQFKEKIGLKAMAHGLIIGVCVSSIMSLIHSYLYYQIHGDFNNSFGSSVFSYIHHPTYFSAFLLISFLLAREGYKQKWRFFSGRNVTIYFLFVCCMLFFCFSFAGLIFTFGIVVYLIYRFIFVQFSRRLFYLSLLIFPALPMVVYESNIHVQISIDSTLNDLKTYLQNPSIVLKLSSDNFSGNNVRLIMWTVSTQEFLAHPLGAGTANVDDVLGNRLRSYNLDQIAEQNYNPHNQYLQIAVEIGVFGLLIFLFFIVSVLRFSIQHKNGLLFWITLCLAFNCLFESMLQRQSGIVFFCFWICFLVSQMSFRQKKY